MAGDIKKTREESEGDFRVPLKTCHEADISAFLSHASYLIFHIPELLFNWLLLLKRIQQHRIDKG